MSFEDLPSPPNINIVSADLLMTANDHYYVRKEALAVARELLYNRVPNSFSSELTDIPLADEMPLTLRALGSNYSRLKFSTRKDQKNDSNDAAIRFWLMGNKDNPKQLEFITAAQPAKFGRDKQFLIKRFKPYGRPEIIGQISCAGVGFMLDGLVPGDGSFSNLTDPRLDYPFDVTALTMADRLRPLARTEATERSYLAKDYQISDFQVTPDESVNYLGEVGSRLVITQAGATNKLRLSSTAPVDLAIGRVIEHVDYSFEPNNKNAMSGSVTLTLISPVISTEMLERSLRHLQANINVSDIGGRALALLLSDVPAFR